VPSRRPARRRPHAPSSDPSARALFSPHSLDAQRYAAFRAGLSAAEIAARENVRVSTVEKSIERLRTAAQLYSQEAVEIAVRRSALDIIPAAHTSILAMLSATREQIRHLPPDADDPDSTARTEWVQAPDHATRNLALARLTDLIESIREQAPLVSANFNTQNNTQNIGLGPGGLSTESLIRAIREEKGLALPAEIMRADAVDALLPDTIDFELQAELAEEAKEAAEAVEEELAPEE
jgi:hypothetical protein